MILRRRLFFLLSFICATALAADGLDCENVHVDGYKYDLRAVEGVKEAKRERSTPPTKELDVARISLCKDLERLENVAEGDQCPTPGTRICLTRTNHKDGNDRVVAVVPVAETAKAPTLTRLDSSPKGLSLLFRGISSYPHPINASETEQSVVVKLLCTTSQEASEPKFVAYDGARLEIEWATTAGCEFKGDDETPPPPGDTTPDPPAANSGGLSSLGWFFLLLILGFITYMALGAYYNFSNYGATGMDLIPHRTFWSDVPYLVSDVFQHLCSSVRPRRSTRRGGYVAV